MATVSIDAREGNPSLEYEPCKGRGTALVVESGRIALVRCAPDWLPGEGLWVFPGGRIRNREAIEEGTVREVMEETGLQVALDRLLRVHREVTEFRTWTNERWHFTFLSHPVAGDLSPRDAEEVLEARWFPLYAPPEGLPRPWMRRLLRSAAAAPQSRGEKGT